MRLIVLFVLLISIPSEPADLIGKWKAPKENTVIHIKQQGDVLEGIIVKSDKEEVVGEKILHDITYQNGKWKGKLYVITKDQMVDVTLNPKGKVLELNIKFGWMTNKVEWQKAE